MKPNSISQIYYDFQSAFDNNPNITIDFYNKHALILNNVQSFVDQVELKFYIEIMCQYINALYQKKRFNSAVDQADKNLILINSEVVRLDADGLKDDWYYSILFTKGAASYHMRDYKTAKLIFQDLVKYDSKNELYKDWLSYSNYGLKIWLMRIVTVATTVMMLLVLVFEHSISNPMIRLFLLVVALTGFIIVTGYDYYLKRSYRKKTSI